MEWDRQNRHVKKGIRDVRSSALSPSILTPQLYPCGCYECDETVPGVAAETASMGQTDVRRVPRG